MTKVALITGIAGQDGSYLAELLLSDGLSVHGIVRRNSIAENQTSRLVGSLDRITLHYGDVTDALSLRSIMEHVQPDCVFNLAGQSHVRISSDVPHFTAQVNAIGVLNVLESVRQTCPEARIYQSSSSEMFGGSVDADGRQRETTPMQPCSPYGAAKLYGYTMVRHYRNAYGMFATNGILFNHTSCRRGTNFVEAKIAKTLAEIAAGKTDKLRLGNLDAQRDIGYSPDYVRAMWMMLQHTEPDDFVVATGKTQSVRDICRHLCYEFGLNMDEVVESGVEQYQRPQELPYLCGDATKIRETLGWHPTVSFGQIMSELSNHWRSSVGRDL